MTEAIDILLVDDEPRNLDALEAILDEPGYRLLRAQDGNAALRLLLDHDVAAIVLDVKMPGLSGFELAAMIKGTKRFRQIPIVFLTAYLVEDHDVITGYGAGAVDYLTKPVNPQILRHKIAVFADLFRKTRALAELNEKLEERVRERTKELERSEAALRAADRHKDEFLAVLAHELRNPLAPLRMGVDILIQQHGNGAPAVVSKTLARMDRQLDHMVRLIDDLLDVSRITRGALELKRERIDLAGVIAVAVDSTRPFLDRRRHQLTIETHSGVFVNADPTRIAQILGNLLHNAAKFTPEGGRVTVQLDTEADRAVVRVTDSGQGIAPEKLERVFEMFAHIEGGDSKTERGLGIGLALARRLAEMHGGSLAATSSGAGFGTTCTLRLPLLPALHAGAATDGQGEGGDNAAARDHLRIVVVEDNADVADTLQLWLEDLGHEVWVARTGPEGVREVELQRPHLVLCDLGLPELDGIEVCRRVRELALATRPLMVALTGWGREDDRRRTRDAGFDDHLVKPVAAERLRAVLRSAAA
jgi:signal transduction histidine kinase